MLNKSRYLDILLFSVKSPLVIKSHTIECGWNQLTRVDKTYFVKKLDDGKIYMSFPVALGHILMEKLFGSMDD